MLDRWLTVGLSAAASAVAFALAWQLRSRRRRESIALEGERRARAEAERAIAERQRVEEALRQSREEWERTFEGVPDLIALLDDQHRITRVNRAMARRLGRQPEECVGLRCYEAVHGLGAPPAACPHAKTMSDGREHTEELREERLGGDFIVSTNPLTGPGGQVVGSVHVARDITGRKRAEEQARRQYAILAGMTRIFQQTLTARTEEDLGATCLAVAEEVTRSRFAFLGEINARAGRLEDVAMSAPAWEACLMEGRSGHGRRLPLSLEIHGLLGRVLGERKSLFTNDPASHPDSIGTPPGHPPLTAFLGVPLLQAGRTVGMMGLANREGGYGPEEVEAAEAIAAAVVQAFVSKRAEEALRDRVEEMEKLMDLAPVAIWFSDDPDCDRIVGNREANRLFDGEDGGDPGAATPARRYFQDGRELRADELPMQRAAAGGVELRDVELEVEIGKGRRVAMLGSAAPLRDAAGRVRGSIAAFVDITARNRVEAERERLLAQVAEADRRKGEFLAVLSHELRNPLAPIRNSLYLLDRSPPGSERAARAREIIHRQTDHLTRLIDDLLDVTRISRGKIELQRESIDAREVVQRACDDHRMSFKDRGLALCAQISGGPVWIDADETRIAQVVGNLLHNAGKFGCEGGTVTVSVGAVGGLAEISVRDDGIGIGPGLLPRVFEPFVQGDECLARTKGGLGLGLALVKGLVELHGGSVRARSEGAGRGAEFTVTLPLGHEGQARRRPTVPDADADAGGRCRVLVIDDNRDEATTLVDALELCGHPVEVAYCGGEGLEKARSFKPDVVLCDIGLPGMDGYEVARAMRADPALAAMKLVAVTGYARPEDVAAAREAGFDQHMAKPASIPELERVIRALPVAGEAGPPPQPSPQRGEGSREGGGARGDREVTPAKEMEVFVSRASHDLRAPLRHIDAFSEALLQDCGAALGEAGRNHLARIRLARRRAQEIIDDLLTLWLVMSAQAAIEVVDLTALACQVSADLRRAEPGRAVEIHVEEGLTVQGDLRLLRVLLQNLLGNAWKYTSRRPSAHIELGRSATPSGVAYFVRDDGAGFDMAYAGKLFEPFQRLHAKGEFEGTGLGLHTVRRVVERHGGRAWVESAPGRGTTVHFTLGGGT